jgi:hypothetical protein
LGLNVGSGPGSGIGPAAAGEPTNGANGHVVVAQDLAAQPHAGQSASGQDRLFGDGHLRWLARHELHPAGRTPGVAAAGMELIDLRLIFQRQYKSFVLRNLEFPYSVNSQFRHRSFLMIGRVQGQ